MNSLETAKKFFQQAFILNKQIDAKLEQIEELKALSEKTTYVLGEVCVQTSHDGQRLQNCIVDLVQLKEETCVDLSDLILIRKNINALIKTVPDSESKLVLEKRYISFKDWDDIADELEVSKSRVFQLHKKGLTLVQFSEKQ